MRTGDLMDDRRVGVGRHHGARMRREGYKRITRREGVPIHRDFSGRDWRARRQAGKARQAIRQRFDQTRSSRRG
jgi:hypothetical protein